MALPSALTLMSTLALSLVFLGCSSRNHSSDIPGGPATSTVSGQMTIEGSPLGTDDVQNLVLDNAETCALGDNQDFAATFGSERLSYRLEVRIRDITEDWQQKNCQQASTNRLMADNGKDQLKYMGCYVSVMAGLGKDFNEYDMHRKDPDMSDYTYSTRESPATCTIKAKIDLQARVFEASEVSCGRMAVTIANGRYANPIYNDRAIDLAAENLRCSF